MFGGSSLLPYSLPIELSLEKELIDNSYANKKRDHCSHCCRLLKTSSIKLKKGFVPCVTGIM